MQDSQGNVSSDTQPVPKEMPTQEVNPKLQEAVSPAPQNTVATPAVESQSQQPVQQVAQSPQATQKKSSGLKCNATTCLLGSCVGCFVFIIILILLAIFAAPFLSDMLNKVVNQGVEVPEITEVSLDDVNESLKSAVEEGGEQTIEMTESEFNTLIKKRFEEEGSGLSNYDLRVGFEKDLAEVYMKLNDWMPWAVISVTGSENGEIEMSSIGIYFENEKITVVVEIKEEFDIELPQETE
jgi:hypothetical protein